MRQLIAFPCEGHQLLGTVDAAVGTTGLLIVSGGNEPRIGAHRGLAMLAATIAGAGHPVFRFDRRGVGDSEGENGGFESSAPDLAAALAAFHAACPQLTHVVAMGNCDAATALMLHPLAVDALILTNPWVIEPQGDLPPPAAIRARYLARLRDPRELWRLVSGGVDLRKLLRGLRSAAAPTATGLATRIAAALGQRQLPVTIVVAQRDNTAAAFLAAWKQPAFDAMRDRATLVSIDSASHSFASAADRAALTGAVLAALA